MARIDDRLGLKLDVELDRLAYCGGQRLSSTTYRSGDTLSGRVILASTPPSMSSSANDSNDIKRSLTISSIRVRCYFESRTLYWRTFDDSTSTTSGGSSVHGDDGKTKARVAAAKLKDATLGRGNYRPHIAHEWHRGGIQDKELLLVDGDDDGHGAAQGSNDQSSTTKVQLGPSMSWDRSFQFELPRRVTIDESSSSSAVDSAHQKASSSSISAELQSWKRTPGRPPPASMRDNPDGSIEWIIEVVVDVDAPNQDDKVVAPIDALGRPRAIPGRRLVCRRTFPFLPTREDWQQQLTLSDESSSSDGGGGGWCDRPLIAGAELLVKQPIDAATASAASGIVSCNRSIRLVSTGALSRSLGVIETSCRIPRRLVISNIRPRGPEVQIPVRIRFSPPTGRLFGSNKSSSSVLVQSLSATLTERTWTRGGVGNGTAATRGHQWQVTYALPEAIGVNLTGDRLVANGDGDGVEYSVDLGDLDLGPTTTKRFHGLLPTVCTPNIERWYDLSLHLAVDSGTRNGTVRYLVGQQEVLVQPEDYDEETTLFEDVPAGHGRMLEEEEEEGLPAYVA